MLKRWLLLCAALTFAPLDALSIGIVNVSSTYEGKFPLHGHGILVKSSDGHWYVFTVSHLTQGRVDAKRTTTNVEYFDAVAKRFVAAKVLSRTANNHRDIEIMRIENPQNAEPLLVLGGLSLSSFDFKLSTAARNFFSRAEARCFDYRGRDGFFLNCDAKEKQPRPAIDERDEYTRVFSKLGVVIADYELLVLGRVDAGTSGLPFFARTDKGFKFVGLASSRSEQFKSGWVVPKFYFDDLFFSKQKELKLDQRDAFFPEAGLREDKHDWRFRDGLSSRKGEFNFDRFLTSPAAPGAKRSLFYEEAGAGIGNDVPRVGSGNGSRSDSGGGTNLYTYRGGLKIGPTAEELRAVTGFLIYTQDSERFLPGDFTSLNVAAALKTSQLQGGQAFNLRICFKDQLQEQEPFANFVWNRLGLIAQDKPLLVRSAPLQEAFEIRLKVMPLPLGGSGDTSDLTLDFKASEQPDLQGKPKFRYSLKADFEGRTYDLSLQGAELLAKLTLGAKASSEGVAPLDLDMMDLFFDSPSSLRIGDFAVHEQLVQEFYQDLPPLRRAFFFSVGVRQFFAFF